MPLVSAKRRAHGFICRNLFPHLIARTRNFSLGAKQSPKNSSGIYKLAKKITYLKIIYLKYITEKEDHLVREDIIFAEYL